ncbi:MAG TPA: SpoIIE family protein phosphatase [Solirubrobacteraceae bacterium]|nr:SpoIIE family protein phosphatase [Solirubrobacteraceae bacterium]
MASQATQPPRGQRAAQRATAAIAAGCCILALASLPTAQAAKNTATSMPTAAGETTSASKGKRAERAMQAERSATAPVAPPGLPVLAEPPVSGRGKNGRATAPTPGPPQAAGHGQASGRAPALNKLDREKPDAHARRQAEGAHRSATSSTQSQAALASGAESTQGVDALARKQKKGGGQKKEKTKEKAEKTKEKAKKPTAPTPVSAGGSKGKQASIVSPQLTTTDPSADSSTTPSAAVGTGSASITSVAPTAAKAGATSARVRRAAHRPRRRTGSRATAAATLAPAIRSAPLAPTAKNGARPSVVRKVVKRARPGAPQPAIVKTLTRIVGVVPTPVRILIAALIALALALAVRSRASGVRARRLMRQRGQLLEDVGLLQAALLPVPPPRLGPVGTSVAYRPADGPGAGGDFYDVFGLDDGRLAVIVGDVSGHGREALPHTALVRFTVRAYLEAGLSPHEALQTAGNVLEHQLAGSFATVVAAIYHPRERTLTYASAGHPPPLVLGDAGAGVEAGATATALTLTTACSAPPLGAGMRTGTRQTVVSVPGPAWLCFHTDGVTEARVGQDLFGSWRLSVALGQLGRDATATALLDSVAERTTARPDDMAACLLRVQDGAGAPTIAHELLELDGAMIAGGRAERFLRESGMAAAAAASVLDAARAELDRRDCVPLELTVGDGPPRAVLGQDNVIHRPALTAVSAS